MSKPSRTTVRDYSGSGFVGTFPASGLSYDIWNNAVATSLQAYSENIAKWAAGDIVQAEDYATLSALITAVGATPKTVILASSINASNTAEAVTVPATLSILPIRPGVINKGSATSLTINGPVVGNPMHQWLNGFAAGEVTFGEGATDAVNVKWAVSGGAGTAASPWTGWEVVFSSVKMNNYVFPQGEYGFDTWPTYALLGGNRLKGLGYVILKHTGTGVGVNLNGGGGVFNFGMEDFTILGNVNTTDDLYVAGVHYSQFKNITVGRGTTAVRIHWCVCNVWTNLVSNANIISSPYPTTGIVIESDVVNGRSTFQIFINPVIGNMTGRGAYVVGALGTQFIGGAFETNNVGIEIANTSPACSNTIIQGVDFEGNTVDDILDNGLFTEINNCSSDKLVHFGANSRSANMIGGLNVGITIDAGASRTNLIGVNWGINNGVLTDNGSNTRRIGCSNGLVSLQPDIISPLAGSWTVTLTCGTSGTITVNPGFNTLAYTKFMNIVYIHGSIIIQSVSAPVGTLRLNLPFTSATGTYRELHTVIDIIANITNATTNYLVGGIGNNVSSLSILQQTSTGVTDDAAAVIKADSELTFSGFYRI